MMWPRISIIMPSLNQGKYIEEAIVSVLEQKYPNLELLILDGGSMDGTIDIIKRYSDYLAYWHSKPDKGQTDALIYGFQRTSGDLWGWLNCDDVLLPGVLERVAVLYMKNPKTEIFFGDYFLLDNYGKILECKRVPHRGISWFAQRGYWVFNSTGAFFSGKAYKRVGGLHLDLDYVMDADLFMRMLLTGAEYLHVGCYVSGFRRHDSAKTVKGIRNSRTEYYYAAERYWPQKVAASRKKRYWKILYWLYQILNGNIRMMLETRMHRGKHWEDWQVECTGNTYEK